ncbi:hypothetical protein ThrDRAFT_01039 [Frankia casuarinae]|jgi:hypothetical protein|uniref:DUF3097 domain-containing protein n=1 Tax=Frankia casuarinae (strain DSM 45818 / CECT 9043 / HFP020203 / CcI3) TaxID=106370 RepID=Q2JDA9_FRACC|nr:MULTISPECIES: DUF3097 domain-containing protein [Frankia]ABD10733.1 conserved hypothetical protein [Frankia casuarinae]EYT93286.1 hypothetical protein ThrDRAFT_01039 [Frankia casuarinae]KDA43961.1 hypothetical protein BMG523Draft_01051 [Frankia sp. BMG5.23]ORT95680.1 hypothetical protein UK99_12090 [Frankia casuarinae]TFE34787.1 DUF3097 domain-containing protein [Frankia sp. B2]
MRSRDYGPDVLAPAARPRPVRPPEVELERDLVVEDVATGFCGAVVGSENGGVTLEDRHGIRRVFPLEPGAFLIEGARVTLVRPRRGTPAPAARTASGSVAVPRHRARVARASRIYVEGLHDAALVERVWGDDLRIEGVVVESLDGVDDLPSVVAGFRPGPGRRLGVLVDHLVPGSKESRIAASVAGDHVLVTGHPYIDIWQAVKPASVGIPRWPEIPRGQPWKEGVCQALGVEDPAQMWRRILASVDSYTDLEVGLLGAVERLIDFVTG